MNNAISIAIGGTIIVLVVLLLAPVSAFAAPADNAFLGGGNALSRATSGESQGFAHATSTSDLLSRLTSASTRGGRSEEVPPANGNADPSTQSLPENANENGVNNANGGASGGSGGNGGSGGTGGLVRAGSVVSNANAVNVLNTVIVRISAR